MILFIGSPCAGQTLYWIGRVVSRRMRRFNTESTLPPIPTVAGNACVIRPTILTARVNIESQIARDKYHGFDIVFIIAFYYFFNIFYPLSTMEYI
jgi:hypothetical protein